MAQNIYDDATFFEEYSRLERSVHGLDGAPEWPTLRGMLPDLQGKRVLDLGCGYGWFCRWAMQNGAARIHGVDISERMLTRARSMTGDAAITYENADLEHYIPPADAFDLVYSSLAFHYLAPLDRLLADVFRSLSPGGHFVFSVEHPIYTAPTAPGWTTDRAGQRAWLINRYQQEGPRSTDWLVEGVIKQHRTIATYIQLLLGTGFHLRTLKEWAPTQEHVTAHPEWADDHERPIFLLVAAQR